MHDETNPAQPPADAILLDLLLESAPIGLAVVDPAFRFARVNDVLARINRLPVAAHLGRTVEEALGPEAWAVLGPLLRRALDGETIAEADVADPLPAGASEGRHFLASYYPLRSGKRVLGVGITVRDITARRRAQLAERQARAEAEAARQRQTFLARASEILSTSLDFERTLGALVRLAVPAIADYCAVHVVEPDGQICPVEAAHVDSAKLEIVRDLMQRFPPDPNADTPAVRVLRTGEPELVTEVSAALLRSVTRDDEQLLMTRTLAPRSYMVVPLRARNRTLGVFTLILSESGRRYGESDLALAEDLARRAALAADNARLYGEAQESERRFHTMADAAPVLLWQSGTDGLCDYFNQPWLDFTGRTMEQEAGNGWAEGVHPDDRDRCLQTYRTRFRAREPFRREYRLRRHDGEYRWVLDTGTPRFGPDGEFAGYIGSCIDITERRQAEQERARLVRDVLFSATGRKLRLCESEDDLPPAYTPVSGPVPLSRLTLRSLRHAVGEAAVAQGMAPGRVQDLETAVGEVANNTVIHARDGVAQVSASESGTVQVRVSDRGDGIPLERLPRALLEKGFTTTRTLGHGLTMTLQTIDRLWLLTGESGTTVVLEQDKTAPEPDWLRDRQL